MQRNNQNNIKPLTLVIMAAGMGSRYGKPKQLDAIGPHDEWLMDYSVFDAIRAGFKKVVFVTSEYMVPVFEEHYRKRIQNSIAFEIVVQEQSGRQKPWGTGHALLSARDAVQTDFAVLNADDFYGLESLEKLKNALDQNQESRQGFLVTYPLLSTLSREGSVSRAICGADATGNLKMIKEHLNVFQNADGALISEMEGEFIPLDPDLPVSLNCWAFTNDFFGQLQSHFDHFRKQYERDQSAEFFLPGAVQKSIDNSQLIVRLIPANSQWFGLTYAADKARAMDAIHKLSAQGIYPSPLWS
jgi:hypothetical protein